MYGAKVAMVNFDPGMSSIYYQQWIELLTFDSTTTNGIMSKTNASGWRHH